MTDTVQDIIARKTAIADSLAILHGHFKEVRNLYYGNFHVLSDTLLASKRYHEVIPPRAKSAVDTIVANMIPDQVTISVEPLKDTQPFKDQAEELEQLGYILQDRMKVSQSISPFAESIKDVVLYGVGYQRILYIKPEDEGGGGEWKQALAARGRRFPFDLAAIDPLNVFPSPTGSFFIENFKRFAFDIDDEFGMNFAKGDIKEELDWIAYWTPSKKVYIVDGKEIVSKAGGEAADINPFGFIPYTTIWSGLGKHSPYGRPEDKAVGILYPLKGLFEEDARLLTGISIIIQTQAVPWLMAKNAPSDFHWPLGPGEMVDIGEMEVPEWMRPPPVNRDIYSLYQLVSQQIQEAIGQEALGGRPLASLSALAQGMLIDLARKRYKALVQSIEAGFSDLLNKMVCMIERFSQPIPGAKIQPKEIHGYYDLKCHFKIKDLTEQRIQAMIARLLVSTGIIDKKTARGPDFMNLSNEQEIQQGLLMDRLLESPEILAMAVIKYAEKMGVEHLLQQAREASRKETRIEVSPQLKQQEERQVAAELYGATPSSAQRGQNEEA